MCSHHADRYRVLPTRMCPHRGLTVLLCLTWATAIHAQDEVDYHGVKLPVSSVSRAGPDSVKVELAGETFLTNEAHAGRRALLRMAQSPELMQGLRADVVETLLRKAAQHNDAEVLRMLVARAVQWNELTRFDSDEAWAEVARSEPGRVAMRNELLQSEMGLAPMRRLCAVGASVLPYLRNSELERWLTPNARGCLDQRVALAVAELGSGFDFVQLHSYLNRQQALWLGQDAEPGQAVNQLRDLLLPLQEALEKGDEVGFAKLLDQFMESAGTAGITLGQATTFRLDEAFVTASLRAKRFSSVLKYVPHLDFSRRTPALHQVLVEAVSDISLRDADSAVSPLVFDRLLQFADKDNELSARVDILLRQIVQERLRSGRFDDAEWLVERARHASALGQRAWVGFARQLIEARLEQGDIGGAQALFTRFRVERSGLLGLRLRLASYGLSLARIALMLCLMVAGGLACRWVLLRRRKLIAPQSATERLHPKEYHELLHLFGLSPGADMNEIKNAYRAAVKAKHPDAQGAASKPQDASEFIRLTTAYDRLVTIHRRLEEARKTSVG